MRIAHALLVVATLAAPVVLPATMFPSPAVQAPAPADGAVTVTGCLARGDAPNTFVLKNIAKPAAPSSQPGSPAPEGSAAPAARSAAATPVPGETLILSGASATLKLDAHVGHTISATGVLVRDDRVVTPGIVLPDPQPQGDTTSRTKPQDAKPAATMRTLSMRSMKHVATECS